MVGAYAPVILPDGSHCAMSVHVRLRGMVIEVERPGTLIPGRDVVAERAAEALKIMAGAPPVRFRIQKIHFAARPATSRDERVF